MNVFLQIFVFFACSENEIWPTQWVKKLLRGVKQEFVFWVYEHWTSGKKTLRIIHLSILLFFFQKAEAQLAYELQAAKINQKIRNEEIQIQVKKRVYIEGHLGAKYQNAKCFEYQTHQFL